jgi:hypothetical protein
VTPHLVRLAVEGALASDPRLVTVTVPVVVHAELSDYADVGDEVRVQRGGAAPGSGGKLVNRCVRGDPSQPVRLVPIFPSLLLLGAPGTSSSSRSRDVDVYSSARK